MYEGRELYLANVHWDLSEKDIKSMFSKYGRIEKVRIPRRIDKQSKGIAFVVFSNKVIHVDLSSGILAKSVSGRSFRSP